MPAIQETMKKGISSLSTNPTGQQIISIINAVAILTFRTAPLNLRKIMRCFRRIKFNRSLRNPYVHVCSRTIDRQYAICQRLLLKTGRKR